MKLLHMSSHESEFALVALEPCCQLPDIIERRLSGLEEDEGKMRRSY
jgi:hypothetical protein